MLSVVIQAGGASRRMGQDKALLLFLGQPLIQRVLARVEPLGAEVLVTTNTPDKYRFLNLPLIPDAFPGRGALGGLYTAIQAASQPFVAVIACDMPFVSPELISAAAGMLAAPGLDAVIPATPGGLEPFHAVYRKETCLPHIYTALTENRWRVDAWFSQVEARILAPEEVARYDPHGMAFWNVNTPEEFQRAEKIAARQKPPADGSINA